MKGKGFVTEEDEEETPEIPPEELFPAYAERYIGLLTGVQDGTRSNYRKMLATHLVPWFKELSVRQGPGGIGQDEISAWVNDLQNGRPARTSSSAADHATGARAQDDQEPARPAVRRPASHCHRGAAIADHEPLRPHPGAGPGWADMLRTATSGDSRTVGNTAPQPSTPSTRPLNPSCTSR
ncbi:hypothetical protein [Streptomyces sp. NPDC055094]